MILLIDNYDSFSYNLYQLLGEIVSEGADRRESRDLGAEEGEEKKERKERRERREI